MEEKCKTEKELFQDLGLIYNKLEQIRNPDFGTVLKNVLKVMAAILIIQAIFLIGFLCLGALFGTAITSYLIAAFGSLFHSINSIQPTPTIGPYNFILQLI
jgi:hypothetical protein